MTGSNTSNITNVFIVFKSVESTLRETQQSTHLYYMCMY